MYIIYIYVYNIYIYMYIIYIYIFTHLLYLYSIYIHLIDHNGAPNAGTSARLQSPQIFLALRDDEIMKIWKLRWKFEGSVGSCCGLSAPGNHTMSLVVFFFYRNIL